MKQVNQVQAPIWFPLQFQSEYDKTDLVYDPFCLKLFAQLEAVKREKFPVETMRQWFIEFVRRGWTKKMLQARYDALLATKIYGVEKLDFADWVNAVPVMAMDEVNLLVKQRIEEMITKGRFLKNKKVELTEEEKQYVELAISKEIEFRYTRDKFEAQETYAQEQRRLRREKRLND